MFRQVIVEHAVLLTKLFVLVPRVVLSLSRAHAPKLDDNKLTPGFQTVFQHGRRRVVISCFSFCILIIQFIANSYSSWSFVDICSQIILMANYVIFALGSWNDTS